MGDLRGLSRHVQYHTRNNINNNDCAAAVGEKGKAACGGTVQVHTNTERRERGRRNLTQRLDSARCADIQLLLMEPVLLFFCFYCYLIQTSLSQYRLLLVQGGCVEYIGKLCLYLDQSIQNKTVLSTMR